MKRRIGRILGDVDVDNGEPFHPASMAIEQDRRLDLPDSRLNLPDNGTVRVVDHSSAIVDYQPPEDRTPMQKTQDEILDNADKDAITASETATSSLAWLELLVDLPRELRHGLPSLLDALQVLIHEERRLRL